VTDLAGFVALAIVIIVHARPVRRPRSACERAPVRPARARTVLKVAAMPQKTQPKLKIHGGEIVNT
jgi:hypothetical protein